jgi:hypothetical protein
MKTSVDDGWIDPADYKAQAEDWIRYYEHVTKSLLANLAQLPVRTQAHLLGVAIARVRGCADVLLDANDVAYVALKRQRDDTR